MKLLLHILLVVCSTASITQGMVVGGDPCSPTPCGSNTQCYSAGSRPVCSCLPGHWGNPLTYCQRGECQDHADCPHSKACKEYRCVDVCASQCGVNADCNVRNHIPVCSCPPGYTGDPLTQCRRFDPQELCDRSRSPCGVNTRCEVINNVPTCSCLSGYFGSPLSGCRHECESDYDCGPSQSCQNYKCTSPCASGACASTAQCEVRNHRAVCSCPQGYLGDPYTSCRAECLTHTDCPTDRPSCLGNQCMNPCIGQCGVNAKCEVRGATPICSCPRDMTGDPFVRCRPFDKYDLCDPNPCGENAKCQPGYDKSGKDRPVCTCLSGYVGDALTYCRRGECQSDNECSYDQVCENYSCVKACTSQCGINAQCNARNHVATCSCPPGYQGDALSRCYPSDNTSYGSSRRGRVYYNKK
uniref:EGF-like domain-containing protein n=1 Tax=Cacopsylla melanoneura TaxID=428564 RepID=A0A8D8WK56_9HEMI